MASVVKKRVCDYEKGTVRATRLFSLMLEASCENVGLRRGGSAELRMCCCMKMERAFRGRENALLSHMKTVMGGQERKITVSDFEKPMGLDHLRTGKV